MADFPVPLDNLIKYVQSLHPDGGPLDRVSDAASVSADLSEESDALLGHFVDQARRSGATWNEIGAAMGVTKQAAQKRFVPGRHGDFSRFTERARTTMASARLLAGDSDVSAAHLGSATLLDPAGIAAKMVGRAGLTPGQVYAALGTAAPVQPPTGTPPPPDWPTWPLTRAAGKHSSPPSGRRCASGTTTSAPSTCCSASSTRAAPPAPRSRQALASPAKPRVST